MKVVSAVKIGNMKDPDPAKRGAVDVLDVPLREIGDDELLIKVAYCAICGSDPHVVGGIFGWEPPFGMGHELSGVVVKTGKNVKNGFKEGDRVAGNFRNYCGSCYYCTNSMEQFCESVTEEPGMAEYVIWNEKQAVKLPDDVTLKTGCLIEPVSVAVRVMDKTNIKIGQNVLVSGGGPIGLLNLQLINIYGAANLTMLEPNPARRELAAKYGAKHVFNPLSDNVKEEAMRITDGRGYDVLLEVSGIPSAAKSMLDLAARGAQIIYVAQYPRDFDMPLNLYDQLYAKEVSITGTFVSPYTFDRTARIIGRLDLEDLSNVVYSIDDAKEAFEAHLSGKYPKVLIKCNPDLE
jgi:(R,R)-butanediol dehydrogenase/meso-butanediol dehydrogenase/diacetyl reductase/L-iditol 2-dehydrogenase